MINMRKLQYIKFNEVNVDDLLALLNKEIIRKHLIEHDLFDLDSIKYWITEKIKADNTNGCKVRGVFLNETLAGWCGIQLEEGKYEIAIVLDNEFWGEGRNVFNDIMNWARELGHTEIYIHFLHTRPEYTFLRKIAKKVYKTELLGNKFTTYQLTVN